MLGLDRRFQLTQEQQKIYTHRLASLKQNENFVKWLAQEPEAETSVVFWHKIMNLSEDKICQSLDLSPGAFRFRLGRGLCSLGKII